MTTFDPSQIFVLGGYEIYERHADDFGVIRIEMPPYVTLGDETGFVVTVGNRGYNTAPVPAVKARVMDGAVCLTDVEMEMPGISSLADGETIECLGRLKFDCADMYRKNLRFQTFRLGRQKFYIESWEQCRSGGFPCRYRWDACGIGYSSHAGQ